MTLWRYVGLGAMIWCLGAMWMAQAMVPIPDWPRPLTPAAQLSLDQLRFAFGFAPRLVLALLVGAVLGLSGALMQAVLRNPLADPTTLGVAGGAQLALVCATILMPDVLLWGRGPVAFAGAALTTGIVMILAARQGFAPVGVTIAGMLIGLLAGAVSTAVTLSQGHYLLSLVLWTGGSLVREDWSGIWRMGAVLACGAIGARLMLRPIAVMALGSQTAVALGVPVAWLRAGVLLLAVWLSASVSAEVGLVGFVGLAAPAMARRLGARRPGQILLAGACIGALLLGVIDLALIAVARGGGPALPSGAMTGLLGGPLMLLLLPKVRAAIVQSHSAPHRRERADLCVFWLICAGVALAAITLVWGRVPLGWGMLPTQLWPQIVPLRAIGLLAAGASGALLASAGAVLQRLTANPMAAPEVLGVTGGASLGYAAVVWLVPAPGPIALALGAGVGAACALAVLLICVARADLGAARVLLAGLAVGAFSSAVLAVMTATGDPRAWTVLGWLSGSAARVTQTGAVALCALALLVLGVLILARRVLEILPLGTGIAQGLGLRGARLRIGLILLAGLATGAASVLVGPVSFVGLMAPHIARSLGLVRAGSFVAGAWILGAVLMVLAAWGARSMTYPYDLPLGLFATLIGAPWLMIALLRRRGL
ncbi:Fe3+-hydroxamate ABC transporter permease FhuB [Thioclava sp. SK-1]|uniref:Fe(3+)-hydroxamate ABC transporter permease FhuB n=1 Tax=Thioclava sp. SK-1 TaxID=1889770 RepID=UPI00082640DE|nr:Fe(3+)-hydroxamate ABC transporter permease FhuB [Thioclava sp. SK-1]OCX66530.1 Fe3+-hydroxamate ABC transporter permease FhuB [Thioclava sp. SK-1]